MFPALSFALTLTACGGVEVTVDAPTAESPAAAAPKGPSRPSGQDLGNIKEERMVARSGFAELQRNGSLSLNVYSVDLSCEEHLTVASRKEKADGTPYVRLTVPAGVARHDVPVFGDEPRSGNAGVHGGMNGGLQGFVEIVSESAEEVEVRFEGKGLKMQLGGHLKLPRCAPS